MKYLIILLLCAVSFGAEAAKKENKYTINFPIIYAVDVNNLEKCHHLGWRELHKMNKMNKKTCGIIPGGTKYSNNKIINEGTVTKLKRGFWDATPDRYVLSADMEKGSRTQAGIACPYVIDMDNVTRSLNSANLSGILSIVDNTSCQFVGGLFFGLAQVDRLGVYSNHGAFINYIVARYYEGRKWWSLN